MQEDAYKKEKTSKKETIRYIFSWLTERDEYILFLKESDELNQLLLVDVHQMKESNGCANEQ